MMAAHGDNTDFGKIILEQIEKLREHVGDEDARAAVPMGVRTGFSDEGGEMGYMGTDDFMAYDMGSG